MKTIICFKYIYTSNKYYHEKKNMVSLAQTR